MHKSEALWPPQLPQAGGPMLRCSFRRVCFKPADPSGQFRAEVLVARGVFFRAGHRLYVLNYQGRALW